MSDPSWADSVEFLQGCTEVAAAQATARLLAQAHERWQDRVVARTSMHDLLFTLPSAQYPFEESVRVSWSDDVYEFTLLVERGKVAAADRCYEPNAPAVLESFLEQLAGDSEAPPSAGQ